jgi:hypothetical protein
VADVKPGNIENWEKEVLDDDMVVENLMGREKNIWTSMLKVKQGQRTAQQSVNRIYTKWLTDEKNIKTKEQFDGVADKKALWSQFDAHMAEKNGGQRGFFQYIESPKAKEDGWMQQGTWYTAGEKKTTPVASSTNLPLNQPQQPQTTTATRAPQQQTTSGPKARTYTTPRSRQSRPTPASQQPPTTQTTAPTAPIPQQPTASPQAAPPPPQPDTGLSTKRRGGNRPTS